MGDDVMGGLNEQRFYIDCEFDGHNGPLLSMAVVPAEGPSIHIKTTNGALDTWVQQNVLPVMNSHRADKAVLALPNVVGGVIRDFIGACACPVIIADSPVDIWRFCAAISTDQVGRWMPTEYPDMRFEVHNVDCYPTDIEGAVRHNAWWDAMALRHVLTAPKGGA